MLEKNIQSKIMAWLKKNRIERVKTIQLSDNGYPDITGVIPPHGKALWIEVKRPGEKPTPLQKYRIKRLKKAGAEAFWTDSLEKVKRRLDKYLPTVPSK